MNDLSQVSMPLFEALRQARQLLTQAEARAEQEGLLGPVLLELDRALAVVDQRAIASLPLAPPCDQDPALEDPLRALREENARLRALLGQEQALLEAILHQTPHGVLVTDPLGGLLLRSRAADRIWAGKAKEGAPGWGRFRAYHPDGRPYEPGDWPAERCSSRREIVWAEEMRIQRFDGTHGYLLGSCAPLIDPSGRLLGTVSVFADITRLKQLEQLKERWVAVAGHEMRTPLSVMKLRVSLARRQLERSQSTDLPRLFSLLEEQVEKLTAMVNDMLDASRVQAGTLTVERQRLKVRPLIQKVTEAVAQTAPGHRFDAQVEDLQVYCDSMRLEQVLTNILSNAVRYSQGGLIRLRAEAGEGVARISVTDQGRGLDPTALEAIFEPFKRLEAGAGREGGLGLGLFLARELLHRMGGRIWAQSAGPGQGATFSFTLPLAQE